jgi:hypothetical protein
VAPPGCSRALCRSPLPPSLPPSLHRSLRSGLPLDPALCPEAPPGARLIIPSSSLRGATVLKAASSVPPRSISLPIFQILNLNVGGRFPGREKRIYLPFSSGGIRVIPVAHFIPRSRMSVHPSTSFLPSLPPSLPPFLPPSSERPHHATASQPGAPQGRLGPCFRLVAPSHRRPGPPLPRPSLPPSLPSFLPTRSLESPDDRTRPLPLPPPTTRRAGRRRRCQQAGTCR